MRKRRVVGRLYGTKYSWQGHKARNRHKNKIKRSRQGRLVYVRHKPWQPHHVKGNPRGLGPKQQLINTSSWRYPHQWGTDSMLTICSTSVRVKHWFKRSLVLIAVKHVLPSTILRTLWDFSCRAKKDFNSFDLPSFQLSLRIASSSHEDSAGYSCLTFKESSDEGEEDRRRRRDRNS